MVSLLRVEEGGSGPRKDHRRGEVVATIGRHVAVVGLPICRGVGPAGGGNVGEASEELVGCALPIIDGGAFVLGQRDGGEHAPQVVVRFEQLSLGESFGV